ncbi:putative tetratricopeptide-like helical domain superfamily [Helianthus annuus]|nr:putative tetratricopeptide-like helical domain superfamily [Helianthus annuus]
MYKSTMCLYTFFLSKNQITELAMKVVSEVQEKGLNLDVFYYSSLIMGFIKQGDLQSAFQFFDEMQVRNIRPNIVTYNINGLRKMGDVKRAR